MYACLTCEFVAGEPKSLQLNKPSQLRRDRPWSESSSMESARKNITLPASLFSRYLISVDFVPPTSRRPLTSPQPSEICFFPPKRLFELFPDISLAQDPFPRSWGR
ncbi:unnamed protein product [Ectocarpus sp. 4 AP-2014]